MARRIFQILRGALEKKPTNLNPGEFYLDTTNDELYLKGKTEEVHLARLDKVLSTSGGTLTGNLRINNSGSDGSVLYFGNDDSIQISKPEVDVMEITAKELRFATQNAGGYQDSISPLPVLWGGTGTTDCSPMRKRTATLTTTWSGSGSNYTQNVAISGIIPSDIPIVVPQISTDAQQTAWNCLKPKVNSYNGGITFYATTKPTTAVPFTVIWNI